MTRRKWTGKSQTARNYVQNISNIYVYLSPRYIKNTYNSIIETIFKRVKDFNRHFLKKDVSSL